MVVPNLQDSYLALPLVGVKLPVFGLCFGTAFVLGIIFGFRYLVPKYELNREKSLTWLALCCGFGAAGGHWVDLIFYRPHVPFFAGGNWLRFFDGLASTGAFSGAVLGSALFCWVWRERPWPYFAMGFEGCAMIWAVGRLGCALIHDHLGAPTTFFLGVLLPDGSVRHDLGLYEFLFLAVFVSPYVWKRRHDKPQPLVSIRAIAWRYGAFRFLVDFLRPEPRYLGLTFAQYFSCGLLVIVMSSLWVERFGFKRWRGARA